MVRLRVVQMEPRFGAPRENLARLEALVGEGLTVAPECALTGYAFESRQEAWAWAEPVPGPSTQRLASLCRDRGGWVVAGLLERSGESMFNSAVVVGPGGVEGVYRKVHLPFLGVDRFVESGDLGFPVFELPWGRVGVLICYDLSFPEAARVLKLRGAQVLCVPANWPSEAEIWCRWAPVVRAPENHLFVATANRVGTERGFRFRGESCVVDPDGRVLAAAGAQEEVLQAEVEPAAADCNRVVYDPGRYEVDRIAHRRPRHYGPVVS